MVVHSHCVHPRHIVRCSLSFASIQMVQIFYVLIIGGHQNIHGQHRLMTACKSWIHFYSFFFFFFLFLFLFFDSSSFLPRVFTMFCNFTGSKTFFFSLPHHTFRSLLSPTTFLHSYDVLLTLFFLFFFSSFFQKWFLPLAAPSSKCITT